MSGYSSVYNVTCGNNLSFILIVLENGLIVLVMKMLGVHRSTRCIKNDSFVTG
jgi:hypothetical protein